MSEEPETDELAHYGIPGMRWGRRKAPEIATPRLASVANEAKAIAGIQATRMTLKKYGHLTVPAAKKGAKMAGKGAKLLFKGSKGGSIGIGKALVTTGKYTIKGGKIYLKGAAKVAKTGFAITRALK